MVEVAMLARRRRERNEGLAGLYRQTRVHAEHGTREIGAGEGIRTLDPNLGKVVLYP
jgi:hypothetical protein